MTKMSFVNLDYLPIKLHYFFFFGAMGGTMPYITVFAKELGINATAVGIIYTILPFCAFLSKPIFGYLTDYFRNIKSFVFILTLVTAVSYISILFLPELNNAEDHSLKVEMHCTDDNQVYISPLKYNKKCLESILQNNIVCELQYEHCNSNQTTVINGTLGKMKYKILNVKIKDDSECISNIGLSTMILPVNLTTDFACNCINNGTSYVRCLNSKISPCFCEEEASDSSSVYMTYQFWMYSLLVVVAGTSANTIFCLNDAACYEVLGDKPELYGRQRLWGTISWGVANLFTGYLNELATGTKQQKDYSPGFYLMLALVVIDLGLLIKIKLTKASFSLNICKDVGIIFSSCETIIFAIAVYIIGALTGLLASYEFWYFLDLGASQTLLGIAIAVQCLGSEVPMLYFSGWFIKTFGHFYCLAIALAAFAFRFGLYFLIVNPWFILPVELLHGFTFGVFYAAMTGYASTKASLGTEATMIGILGGLYEGLGAATGSLLGGVGFDKLGGRTTFFIACAVSLLCIPAILISHLILRKRNRKQSSYSFKESLSVICDSQVSQKNVFRKL